jgi:hypothetical protein
LEFQADVVSRDRGQRDRPTALLRARLHFHRRLRCLTAIDLKIGAFQPEHKGKMEFYLEASMPRNVWAGRRFWRH